MKWHIAVALLVLFQCVSCGNAIGFVNWGFGIEDNSANSNILYGIYSVPGQIVPYGQRSVDSWSNFFVGVTPAPSGGVDFSATQNIQPSFGILTQNNVISGLDLTTTLRIDDAGWEVVLWELYNPTASPVPFTLSNGATGDVKSSKSFTQTFATSSGTPACDATSSWCVSYYDAGGSVGPNFPVLITSFGEANTLGYFHDVDDGYIKWSKDVVIPPLSTVGFLEVLGVQNPTISGVLASSALIANNALASASTLYTYTAANGRLLAHLTANQLLDVVNWNFAAAGVGGDPHGLNFDGSHFELPNSPSVYCLFSTRDLQVNIQVGAYGFITEVVVFARAHGRELHAKIVDEFPDYSVGHRSIGVPENLNEFIFTAEAPFHFQRSPLNELERYHVSSLVLRGAVTIVGGVHPVVGGFFNVAVHTPSSEVGFPSILQLPNHPQRDVGFAASQIENVWFDLAN